MLVEKSDDNRNLKDLWAAYRKKEVQMECQITDSKPIEIQPQGMEMESDVKSASLEAEQIGDKVVKVHFIEYIGKRKKKVTRIEVDRAELNTLLQNSENQGVAQLSMF